MNMRFTLRFVHKVSQVCKCGRSQYDHSIPHPKPLYPGHRQYGEGPYVRFHDGVQTCAGYEPETEQIDLDVSQIGTIAKRLAGAKCDIRREANGRIVCFPRSGIWHSLIFTPEGA